MIPGITSQSYMVTKVVCYVTDPYPQTSVESVDVLVGLTESGYDIQAGVVRESVNLNALLVAADYALTSYSTWDQIELSQSLSGSDYRRTVAEVNHELDTVANITEIS